MAALIEYVCNGKARSSGGAIGHAALEQGSWAYCSCGAISGHQWTRIDPTAIEALRSPGWHRTPTSGAGGESADPSTAGRT